MTVKYSIFTLADGKYQRTIEAPDWDNIVINFNAATETAVEGEFDDSYYFNGSDVVTAPPMTQAEYDAYKARVRSESYMTRYEFIKAIDAMDNDFSDEDLQMLARGEFPAIVESVLATMPAEESKDAKFKWAAMNTVCRTDALIVSLAAAMGFSEFDLDDTFGIVLDPPPV